MKLPTHQHLPGLMQIVIWYLHSDKECNNVNLDVYYLYNIILQFTQTLSKNKWHLDKMNGFN